MNSKELRRLNHKSYLRSFIFANPDMHLKMAIGFVKGMKAGRDYRDNPEKLPTTAKFWFSQSIFAHGFRSAFTQYAGQGLRNEVDRRLTVIYQLNNLLDK
jgi:hypothetical protein